MDNGLTLQSTALKAPQALATVEAPTKGMNTTLRQQPGFPALPVELVERICNSLDQGDKCSLIASCSSLWSCPGLASSTELWGSFALHMAPGQQEALAAWLSKRRLGLRRVALDGWGAANAELVLLSLLGSKLVSLELQQWRLGEGGESLALLPQLKGLRRLDIRCSGLAKVPPQLVELSESLEDLGLGCNERLGWGEAAEGDEDGAFGPLKHLSKLTRLDLSHCTLRTLPSELSALSELQSLDISGNGGLGRAAAAGQDSAFEPLRHLPALEALDASSCALEGLPAQLAALGALRELRLEGNSRLGSGGGDAFWPLEHLAGSLRTLDLRDIGLERVPRQLSAMSSLGELLLGGNGRLGAWGVADAFAPLPALAKTLTRLDMSRCRLAGAPQELAALKDLQDLDLSGNDGFKGAQNPLDSLRRLAKLTRLDVRGCGLGGAGSGANGSSNSSSQAVGLALAVPEELVAAALAPELEGERSTASGAASGKQRPGSGGLRAWALRVRRA